MRALSGSVFVLCLILACVAFAQTSQNPNDLYAVGATVTPGANGYYTIRVTVTEKAGGAVVFEPKVTLPAGIHAEVFSDPVENRPLFECAIDVNTAGKANVTFRPTSACCSGRGLRFSRAKRSGPEVPAP